ncbi:MAG TPA: CRISPR-associated endonuclease Cas2 [Candidatus Cloacimonadota bacterium]|jgi:CRISPR-associated protein Cas2|nr:CRISPR-associated endonuclease Cas2 [Candidatus Cloacimonadales bacterium]HOE91063.1 CRISPR-associated endonuclease Cas2 [Candidatus Cloacimonadota bacterium]HOQ81227.1 CRISPR-associated endonuclease Cas2 [Candidatus Cloacimonadota bacterium]HPY97216.1 CRISPR-associated endonuclease Cas2 [Candidatus Cloacimonadota bacterium]
MLTWVLYDIQKDKARSKVAKACLESGIYRVQYSVFLGDLNKTQTKELLLKIEELCDEETDSVYIFPMCAEDFKSCVLYGQAFDKELVSDELLAFFL